MTGARKNVFDQVLPHSLDAERAVLGSIIQQPSALLIAQQQLPSGPAEFFRPSHGDFYGLLLSLQERRMPFDGVVLKDEMLRLGKWKGGGEYDFMGGLIGAVPSALRIGHYAEIVHRAFVLRRLVNAAAHIQERAMHADGNADAALAYASHAIREVGEAREIDEGCTLQEAMAELDAAMADAMSGKVRGLQTHLPKFNAMTGGLQPSALTVLAARPSVGKTALLLNLANQLSVRDRKRGLFFSLEMPNAEIMGRLVSDLADCWVSPRRAKPFERWEREMVANARQELLASPLVVRDRASVPLDQLRAVAAHEKAARGLEYVLVDYLQLVQPSKRCGNREQEVSHVAQGLKELAKDLRVPVVAACQLRRALPGTEHKRPMLSDLRESGGIEQAADNVLFLHRSVRPATEKIAGGGSVTQEVPEVIAILEKHRSGETGEIKLDFKRLVTRFTEVPDAAARTNTSDYPNYVEQTA